MNGIKQYIQEYYAELPFSDSAYLAWLRTEAKCVELTGKRRFGTYKSFKAAKSRFLAREKPQKQAPITTTKREEIFKMAIDQLPEDRAKELQMKWDSCLT